MPFAKGLKRSSRKWLGLGHPHHLSAVVSIPEAAETALPPPLDQGDLGSCTGNSFALALQVEMKRHLPTGAAESVAMAAATWPELPSRLFLYYNARKAEGTVAEDSGAMLSDIFDAAAKLGFPPESAWPYPDPRDSDALLAWATTQPDFGAYERAADQKLLNGVWRITSTGQALSDDIATAIAAGEVVVWGTDLDQAFENLKPGDVWPGVKGRVIGGHAMVLHGYRTVAQQKRFHPHPDRTPLGLIDWPVRDFKTRSSWGDWCEGGSAWVSEDAITSPHASEFFVVSVSPQYSEAVS